MVESIEHLTQLVEEFAKTGVRKGEYSARGNSRQVTFRSGETSVQDGSLVVDRGASASRRRHRRSAPTESRDPTLSAREPTRATNPCRWGQVVAMFEQVFESVFIEGK